MIHPDGASSDPPDRSPGIHPGMPVLQRSVPCHRCGYELLGLPMVGACPECGSSIERSVELAGDDSTAATDLRDGLRFVRAGWVTACLLLLGCCAAPVVLLTCAVGSGFRVAGYVMIARSRARHRWAQLPRALPVAICSGACTVGLTASLVLSLVGTGQGTAPGFAMVLGLTWLAVCVEGLLWMRWLRSTGEVLGHPFLEVAGALTMVVWTVVAVTCVVMVASTGSRPGTGLGDGVIGLVLVVGLSLGALCTVLVGNLLSDLLRQIELGPGSGRADELAIRMQLQKQLRTPPDPGRITPADSSGTTIVPERPGISGTPRRPGKRGGDPPRNPGGTY